MASAWIVVGLTSPRARTASRSSGRSDSDANGRAAGGGAVPRAGRRTRSTLARGGLATAGASPRPSARCPGNGARRAAPGPPRGREAVRSVPCASADTARAFAAMFCGDGRPGRCARRSD
jgi:hypothetical protein